MAETGVWDACVSLAHVCATAALTRVDDLMVTVDAADDVDGKHEHAAPKRMLVLARRARWLSPAACHSLRGSPRRAHDTQTASAIGSDLVPTKTGQPAAHGGHSRARRGRTVKMKIPVRIPLIDSLRDRCVDARR